MILSELKVYLQNRKKVSLHEIAVRFDTPQNAVAGMLEHWERKGRIKRADTAECANACGHKCESCPVQCTQIYEWID